MEEIKPKWKQSEINRIIENTGYQVHCDENGDANLLNEDGERIRYFPRGLDRKSDFLQEIVTEISILQFDFGVRMGRYQIKSEIKKLLLD
jgi:hypothetical protein